MPARAPMDFEPPTAPQPRPRPPVLQRAAIRRAASSVWLHMTAKPQGPHSKRLGACPQRAGSQPHRSSPIAITAVEAYLPRSINR